MDSSRAIIQVIRTGLLSTIQDNGRFGLRHLGIPWAGTLCPAWQELANALVGNEANAPVIECFEGGLHLQIGENDVLLAVVGSDSAIIKVGESEQLLAVQPNRSVTIAAGESLHLTSTGNARHALVAIAGIDIQKHLGSSSTYAKASLGGIDGSALQVGQTIHVTHQTRFTASKPFLEQQCQLPEALRYQSCSLRVIAGPQYDHFSENGKYTFLHAHYELGIEADRMGVRLQGPMIEHRDANAKDIVSDAIVPGSIQVPGTGLPIVLLNDAHTAGGYPKIATVVSCDLPLLGIQRPGAKFGFNLVTIDDAIAASAHLRKLIDNTIRSLKPCVQNKLDSQTLLATNLIDGVTNGL